MGKLRVSEFASQHGRLLVAALMGMLPFFALTQYFGWAYEETTLTIRALRLILVLGGSGVAYLLCAKLFKVSEISGLRAFATSVLQRRRKN